MGGWQLHHVCLPANAAAAQAAAAQRRRFILPLSDCEFASSGVLDELQRDAFPTPADVRPSRCTGAALQVRRWRNAALAARRALKRTACPASVNQYTLCTSYRPE